MRDGRPPGGEEAGEPHLDSTARAETGLTPDATAPDTGTGTDHGAVERQIGRYEVQRVVGTGGMGLVVAAHDPELGRLVAIKLVAARGEEARTRLEREAQAMARLSHPNVVVVHEVIRLEDRAGIVMELVEGEDLATWCAVPGRSWREIVAAHVQAARGLDAAHRAGLVHRDFKPSNALVRSDGVVRVIDFGLVRAAGLVGDAATDQAAPPEAGRSTPGLTRTGVVMGTPAYMAPEQHESAAVDARTDQWALACSLYEALHGQRPFEGTSRAELSSAVLAGKVRPEPPGTRVPRAIRAAVRRALSRRPDDRFATMDELIAAISPARRRWQVVAGLGAAVAAAVAVVAVLIWPGDDPVTCSGLDAPWSSIWSTARAEALRARFAAVDQHSDKSARHVTSRIADYGGRWVAARVRACTDARRGQSSSELLDRRMRCLDRRLLEIESVIGGLLEADPTVVRGAGQAVDRLPDVSYCDDAHDTVPRPSAPAERAAIASAEEDVARGRAYDALGRCDLALPRAASAVAVGERTGWTPLLASALALRGVCENKAGDYRAALASLERAATAAAQARDDALVAEALARRFFVLGERLGQPAEALAGRRFVELALERAGQPRRERAIWLHSLAVILLGQGKLDEALAAQSAATATWRELVPPGHVLLIDSLQTHANIHSSRGEFAAARALLDETMASELAAGGPDHPRVAVVLTNLGLLDVYKGDIPAAIEKWQQAATIQRGAGLNAWIATSNVGLARASIGRWRAARDDLTSALADSEIEAPGDSRPVAYCAGSLGVVLLRLGELDQAEAMLARAARAARSSGDASIADILTSSAELALARGDRAAARAQLAEAAALAQAAGSATPETAMRAVVGAEITRSEAGCRAARPIYERALAAAKPDSLAEITAARTGLGECLTELGDPAAAVELLQPRVAWLEEMGADPGAAARARFALARALAAQAEHRGRARPLAEAARTGFATLGPGGQARASAVDRWLDRLR